MGQCDACGEESDNLLYTCNECGKTLCSDHRLPEKHLCGVRDRVGDKRTWSRGEAARSTSPVSGEDARAECKTEDCTNTSDAGSPFCPKCLNRHDREQDGDTRSQFGETDCKATSCNNVAGHGESYCLDCRRKQMNSDSSPAVETTNDYPSNSAGSGGRGQGTAVPAPERSASHRARVAAKRARVHAGNAFWTVLGIVFFPFFLAKDLIHKLFRFLTSTTGILVLVVVVLVAAAGPLGLISVNDDAVAGFVDNTTNDSQVQGEPPADGTTERSESGEWNADLVEEYFIMYLNQERASRGLQNVSERDVLTEMGAAHSLHMVENDYFDHTEPDGTTVSDRYNNRGLLPECRLEAGDGTYYKGAENLAQTYVDSNVVTDDGSTVRLTSERELARHIFKMWMNSKGHREAMLVSSADQAGLGIAFEGDKVYASLELC